jgi:hypothetical protein
MQVSSAKILGIPLIITEQYPQRLGNIGINHIGSRSLFCLNFHSVWLVRL